MELFSCGFARKMMCPRCVCFSGAESPSLICSVRSRRYPIPTPRGREARDTLRVDACDQNPGSTALKTACTHRKKLYRHLLAKTCPPSHASRAGERGSVRCVVLLLAHKVGSLLCCFGESLSALAQADPNFKGKEQHHALSPLHLGQWFSAHLLARMITCMHGQPPRPAVRSV